MPIPIYNSKHVKSLSGTGQQSYKCKYIPIKNQFLYGIPSQDRVNPDSMQKEKKRHPFLLKKTFFAEFGGLQVFEDSGAGACKKKM